MRKRFIGSIGALLCLTWMTAIVQADSLSPLHMDYPKITFDQSGRITYSSSDDLLEVSGTPFLATFALGDQQAIVSQPQYMVRATVDASGNLIDGTLEVRGRIAGINDSPQDPDLLLDGTAVDFDYVDNGTLFSFKFSLRGGVLADRYAGQLAAMEIASEGSTFQNFEQDFSGYAKGSISGLVCLGDRVWLDHNANGVQDEGEPGVAGVTVELYNTADPDSPIQTTVTDDQGFYLFTNLQPTSKLPPQAPQYIVKFIKPDGFLFSPALSQGPDATFTNNADSNADVDSGQVGPISLQGPSFTQPSWGAGNRTIDAGLYKPAALGDFVWNDCGGHGIQGPSEEGIAGITVNLYDAEDALAATATTDENGRYLFEDLEPGSYTVEFVKPDGYVFTAPLAGADRSLDSDADPTTGRTSVTLASGEVNRTIDAGMYERASVSGYIYHDSNRNKVKDAGESGIAGVSVTLSGVSNLGESVQLTTETEQDGSYSFADLDAGTYTVTIDVPTGYKSCDTSRFVQPWCGQNKIAMFDLQQTQSCPSSVTGKVKSGCSGVSGVTVSIYDSRNVLKGSATTGRDGSFTIPNLTPGTYTVKMTVPAGYTACGATSINVTLAACQTKSVNFALQRSCPSSVTGKVKNGCSGVPGVTVSVYDDRNTLVGSATTGRDGAFTIGNLPPGTYTVKMTVPAGYTAYGAASACVSLSACQTRTVNFAIQQCRPAAITGSVKSGCSAVAGVTIGAYDSRNVLKGSDTTGRDGTYTITNLPPGTYTVRMTVPAGYSAKGATSACVTLSACQTKKVDFCLQQNRPATVTGSVKSGCNGMAGVTIRAYDSHNVLKGSATTDRNGAFTIDNLPPGTYTIKMTVPSGYSATGPASVSVTLSSGQKQTVCFKVSRTTKCKWR